MTTDNTQATHMDNSGKSPSYALGDAQAERNKLKDGRDD